MGEEEGTPAEVKFLLAFIAGICLNYYGLRFLIDRFAFSHRGAALLLITVLVGGCYILINAVDTHAWWRYGRSFVPIWPIYPQWPRWKNISGLLIHLPTIAIQLAYHRSWFVSRSPRLIRHCGRKTVLKPLRRKSVVRG